MAQSLREFLLDKRVLKYFGLKFFSIPGIYGYLLALLKLLDRDLDVAINSMTRGFAKGDIFSKIRYRPPSRMLALLSRRLSNCSDRTFERRESKARQFLSLLLPEIPYPGKSADYHSFWVVPILVPDPESLMATLRENGFDATRGNTSLTFIEDSRCCDRLSASHPLNAERLINSVLYLPISEDFPEAELTRLAQLVNEFYTNTLNFEQLRLPVLPSN
jgi:perosamine synthetase